MTGFEGKEEKLPGVNESRRALNFESACQWVGLALLMAIIIAAVLGIFSNGYFSSANAVNSAQTLRVNYERFGRLQTEYKIELTAKTLPQSRLYSASAGILIPRFSRAVLPRSLTICLVGITRCIWFTTT